MEKHGDPGKPCFKKEWIPNSTVLKIRSSLTTSYTVQIMLPRDKIISAACYWWSRFSDRQKKPPKFGFNFNLVQCFITKLKLFRQSILQTIGVSFIHNARQNPCIVFALHINNFS